MKFLLLLLLAVPVFSQSIEDRVKKFDKPKDYTVEYDKFQKVTTVRTESAVRSTKYKNESKVMHATAYIEDGGRSSVLMLFSAGRGSFFNQPTLRFLADDELVEISSNDIDRVVVFTINPLKLKKIASAKKVEMQLETFEGVLDDETITKLRNLASLAN